jgi:beta-1,4-mannosyl-glycoprotein beta-1,4-N-acetylglucosaminyltransferase
MKKYLLEIGAWAGRSSIALADNMPKDATLFCVDHWLGSEAERETNHQSAAWLDGDYAYDQFCRNLWDHIEVGRVIPLRMHSKHAAKLLLDMGIKFLFIFIDGGHTYVEVQEDINNFLPLLAENGTICGHDYLQSLQEEVTPAVNDIFGKENIIQPEKTHIWYTNYNPLKSKIELKEKSDIYDCFIFNNELDLLLLRFETLYDVVDRFVIVEATSTHQRKPKPLYFRDNLDKFNKYLHKITHIVCEFPPELNPNAGNDVEAGELYWQIERYQRNKIMDGLTECNDNDIILISDLDEIPNPEVIKNYKSGDGIKSLEMDLFYYNLNCKAQGKWCEAKIAPFCTVRALSPCGLRYTQAERILNAGNHCSYFGGVDSIIEKINNTAHREYNTDYFKNPERIKKCIENCEDIFERPNEKFTKI